uniref:Uncharacterized protein n=1 Tax=Octopus bimaculoides TaxID=37653 RepID=A0A0L8HK95_OCTBM
MGFDFSTVEKHHLELSKTAKMDSIKGMPIPSFSPRNIVLHMHNIHCVLLDNRMWLGDLLAISSLFVVTIYRLSHWLTG